MIRKKIGDWVWSAMKQSLCWIVQCNNGHQLFSGHAQLDIDEVNPTQSNFHSSLAQRYHDVCKTRLPNFWWCSILNLAISGETSSLMHWECLGLFSTDIWERLPRSLGTYNVWLRMMLPIREQSMLSSSSPHHKHPSMPIQQRQWQQQTCRDSLNRFELTIPMTRWQCMHFMLLILSASNVNLLIIEQWRTFLAWLSRHPFSLTMH